jgi:hypothetical protein
MRLSKNWAALLANASLEANVAVQHERIIGILIGLASDFCCIAAN